MRKGERCNRHVSRNWTCWRGWHQQRREHGSICSIVTSHLSVTSACRPGYVVTEGLHRGRTAGLRQDISEFRLTWDRGLGGESGVGFCLAKSILMAYWRGEQHVLPWIDTKKYSDFQDELRILQTILNLFLAELKVFQTESSIFHAIWVFSKRSWDVHKPNWEFSQVGHTMRTIVDWPVDQK